MRSLRTKNVFCLQSRTTSSSNYGVSEEMAQTLGDYFKLPPLIVEVYLESPVCSCLWRTHRQVNDSEGKGKAMPF